MISTPNPWEGLRTPTGDDIATRLINLDPHPKGVTVCWAITSGQKKCLSVTYPSNSQEVSFPKLDEIKILRGRRDPNKKTLLLELENNKSHEQFKALCENAIGFIASSSPQRVESAIALCLKKWQYLMKRAGTLGQSAQKGLIAEIYFLERCALRSLSPIQAVNAWMGPLKGVRDFAFGKTYVEVKSNRGSQNPMVTISSEHQLATGPGEELYLYIVGLESSTTGPCLSDVIKDARTSFSVDPYALGELEAKLAAAGYSDEDDYTDARWQELGTYCYHVVDGFPRIQDEQLYGIEGVSYKVDLRYCTDYVTNVEELYPLMNEASEGEAS